MVIWDKSEKAESAWYFQSKINKFQFLRNCQYSYNYSFDCSKRSWDKISKKIQNLWINHLVD